MLGTQVLALALGGDTYKLEYGHGLKISLYST